LDLAASKATLASAARAAGPQYDDNVSTTARGHDTGKYGNTWKRHKFNGFSQFGFFTPFGLPHEVCPACRTFLLSF